jgi:hypothetical protein
MRIARAHLVDPAATRWYYCVTRCVRGALLVGEGPEDRKLGIENRLEQLAQNFGLSVSGSWQPQSDRPETWRRRRPPGPRPLALRRH